MRIKAIVIIAISGTVFIIGLLPRKPTNKGLEADTAISLFTHDAENDNN